MTLGFNFDAVVAGRDSFGRPVYMARAAAPYLIGLVAEYEASKDPDGTEWGSLVILEGGRLLARQQYLWDGYAKRLPGFNIAAYPGTGMHDKDGRAVDFGAGWNSYTQIHWKRLNRIAAKWGFNNRQGRATGKNGEPWHWVWEPGTATVDPKIIATISAAGVYDITNLPTTPTEVDDLMATPEQRAALITELLNHTAYDPAPGAKPRTVSEVLKNLDKGGQFIRIQAPGKGIAIIGPGYFRGLAAGEELENSDVLISAHWTGNDRQFDLWKSLALAGIGASPVALPAVGLTDTQITAIATRVQASVTAEVDGIDDDDAQQIAAAVADILGRRISGAEGK